MDAVGEAVLAVIRVHQDKAKERMDEELKYSIQYDLHKLYELELNILRLEVQQLLDGT